MAEGLNVILVVLDGARADHFSCYGHARETTPFLDQVAREGVRFSSMIAAAPSTLPAHASLFTGLYAATHGATDENRFLWAQHQTLPEQLRAAGYRTAAFCTAPWVGPETGFGRGFDAFFTQRYHNRVAARAISYGRKASDTLLRRNDAGARRTNQALRRWLVASEQPFFAFVHYNETHLPFEPPRPYDRMFLPRGVTAARVRAVNQDSNKYLARQLDMSEEDFAILASLYDGGLRYVDMRLREMADFLRAQGQWDRTLFIVTGDHGESLGEHLTMGHKSVLYDTVLRVPLLLRCPARVPRGFVVDELAQTTDLMPTILRMVDVPEDAGKLEGRALLQDGHATPGPGFAISECFRPNLAAFRRRFPECDVRGLDVRKKAIRTKREKFVWQSAEANELYDLVADAGERNNLIEREPVRADRLRRQLFDWLASVEKFEGEGQPPEMGAVIRAQLRALGDVE
jgi:arylsulfatase A-like enzyme